VKPPRPGRLGSLILAGGWQSSLNNDEQADRLKRHEGEELEIGEIVRLAGPADWRTGNQV